MEDPFPSSLSSSFLDHYATSGCTLTEILEYSDECGKSSSLGFMELLNMQDFAPSPSAFGDVQPEPLMIHRNQDSKVQELMMNAPATPNTSSISSESSDGIKDEHVKQDDEEEEDDDVDEEKKKTKKQLKVKKTIQKKQREPRFAFMTKSEVDHLEDGYRWRKYGQKAVKNSPFPRSYYKCTNATCNVKKRVERSYNDPSIVVTTYEGQHTHPSPQVLRPPSAAPPPPHNPQLINYSALLNGYMGISANCGAGETQPHQLSFSPFFNNGLLQDVVPAPWPAAKREDQ
ncbi:WRKY DNA-binding protein 23 [Perilla frutescens var. hirtella]|uniref:WRKY DNA-binding protein 23 n=1 Tax=Perilla frutescens var. hirtella TaxID=608512 RepID=A0AAD4IZ08_PERFH|nr:WRKY DNA-binding protein 23 [Perilla frutescens var. hirtella]